MKRSGWNWNRRAATTLLAAVLTIAMGAARAMADACCMPNGTCQTVVDQAACNTAGGCWQGSGSSCVGRFCPVADAVNVGACINPFGGCSLMTELDCLCLNGANLDNANQSFWAGAGTDCGTLPDVNFEQGGGQINISGATLFAPFFQNAATTNDWINPDNDKIPCSGDGWSQFKDTNCNSVVDFIGGDRSDQLSRAYQCGQTWWGYWLVQYRSVGSVNGYTEFIDYQLLNRLPTTVPTEIGIINRCQWASGGAKTGPCAGCESHCLVPTGSGDMNCDGKFNAQDVDGFLERLLSGIQPPCAPPERADFDGDLAVTFEDIPGFVSCMLTLGGCYQNNSASGQTGTPVCPNSIDLACLDVPGKWGTVGPAGTGAFDKRPNQPGYGQNFVPSSTGFISQLATLTRQVDPNSAPVSLNFNATNPNANTLYDTPVAFVAVVPISTQGTGVQKVRFTELRHLLVTGRMPNGENLVGTTRDVGSGTRNAWCNPLGIDPAWGMGDNEGGEIFNENPDARGPGGHLGYVVGGTNNVFHYSNNCGGSGITERCTQNRRLAIGYTGLFGSGRAITDAVAGNYEILDVCKDIDGDGDGFLDSDCSPQVCDGALGNPPGCNGGIPPFFPPGTWRPANDGYVRPSVNTIIDNSQAACAYTIGGFATFVSRGDPESGRNGNTNPPLANLRARDYLRNIKDSIAAYVLNPTFPTNQQMPGSFLASTFTLPVGLDHAQDLNIPTKFAPNPELLQPVQDAIRCTTTQVTPAYGVSVANKTPQRVNQNPSGAYPGYPGGPAYSDGSMNGQYAYNGATFAAALKIGGNVNLNDRNEVMGDFDVSVGQKKIRNANDIDEMMVALCDPRAFELGIDHGGPTGALAIDHVIPEIIGDFTGDGNFTAADARYFADGLAMDPLTGKLDRKLGFTLVDQGWAATTCGAGNLNYFGTTLKTAKPYAPGDSRGDVAGNVPVAGANPVGSDGCINAADIDYIWSNFTTNWADLSQSINTTLNRRKDLSCDMDGDLDVDAADVTELVETILCTRAGDADLDGDVDGTDLAIVQGNLGNAGGWAAGDFNGDGLVNAADESICILNQGFTSPCAPLTGTPCP